jgi:hypothetical protein
MLTTIIAAANKLIVAGGSITDKGSALFHPAFRYSHHQKVSGVIFDAIVTVSLISGSAIIAYRNWGPPAKRKLAVSGGVDDSDTLRQEGMLLGVQPWVWSLICYAILFVTIMGSVIFYD